jgi:alpha-glucosidase
MEASQQLLQGGRVAPLLLSDGPSYTRTLNRYGDGSHDIAAAKPLAAVLLASRSGALLYFGQELGLGSQQTIHWDAPPKPKPGAVPAPVEQPNAAVQDGDPASLLSWYRQLSALHHGNRTISSGEEIILNHDDQNVLAWVRKPQAVSQQSPAVVLVCNLSAQPVTVSLKADMQKLRLRGSFLRPVLRSDRGMGAMHLDGMTLGPYMVYIGELRF